MQEHCGTVHGCASSALVALHRDKRDLLTNLFAVCLEKANLRKYQEHLIERADKLNVPKRKHQIFEKMLECALCGFRSKVRQDLISDQPICVRDVDNVIDDLINCLISFNTFKKNCLSHYHFRKDLRTSTLQKTCEIEKTI